MKRFCRATLGVAVLIALALQSAIAHAENLFEGQAEVRISGDRARARERALDDALRASITAAATSLFGDEGIKQKSSELRLRVLPKAKSYASSYRIVAEDEEGANLVLRLVADVNLELLSRDLTTAVAPVAPPAPTGPFGVCLTAGNVAAAERVLGRLTTLRVIGKLVNADGSCPATFAADRHLLMLDIATRAEGGVRGTGFVAAVAQIKARLAKAGAVEASPEVQVYGWGPDAGQADLAALDRAATKLGLQLVPLVGARIGASLPQVEVHLNWKRTWADVALLQKVLQQTAGVDRAAVRSVDAQRCVIEVEGTLSAAALLDAISRSPLLEAKGNVAAGNKLELEVTRKAAPMPGSGS